MAVKTVLKMGDPRLFEVAKPVTAFDTPQLHEMVQDMHHTMEALNGAGL
ncbi:MAG: peptide deformylase, partial [Burkholderiales bacterium]